MKPMIIVFFTALFFSCNTQPQQPPQQTGPVATPDIDTRQPPNVNCYRYANAGDTIILKIGHTGERIDGSLIYHLKEKDKNEGTLLGNMKNDLLIADYHFMSEGIRSTRQVAFKLENKTFTEGFGEIISENNKARFKNIDSLGFSNKIKLAEISCM